MFQTKDDIKLNCIIMEASKRPAENGSNGDSTDAKKAKLDPDCGSLLFCGTTEWQNVRKKFPDFLSLNKIFLQALKPGKLKEDNYHSKNNVHEPMRLAALKNVRIRHVGSGQDGREQQGTDRMS